MCGIVAWYGPGERQEAISRAVKAMDHRGPDGSGQTLAGSQPLSCILGHTRLAIIDLTPLGAQPMEDERGQGVLTFNGEIFNHHELRRELLALGETFRSRSDTEVLLRALLRWGTGCIGRLRGMFAFAFFDRRDGSLLVARDQLGVKPLYLAKVGDGFLFASEVRALLATGLVPRRLDSLAVLDVLSGGSVCEPRTAIRGVVAVPPGTWMEVRGREARQETYWELPTPQGDRFENGVEAAEFLRDEFDRAVKIRLEADVPVGVFLSGGIDSRAVLERAARHSPHRVKTLTVALEDRKIDERQAARATARQFGSEHHEVLVSAGKMLEEVDVALSAVDQPSADGLNTYFVSQAARQAGLRVALSGLGGDELFAGYRHFRLFLRATQARDWLRRLPRLQGGKDWTDRPRWERLVKASCLAQAWNSPVRRYRVIRGMFLPHQIQSLAPGLPGEPHWREGLETETSVQLCDSDPVNAYSRLELRNYLLNTLLRDTDGMSMACSLEVRAPFVDHRLVELALAVPGRLKLATDRNKPLLVAAMEPGAAALQPGAKLGFWLPYDSWFRGPLREWMTATLLRGPLVRSGLLDGMEVERTWRAFLAGHPSVTYSRIWTLAVLSQWCERNGVQP